MQRIKDVGFWLLLAVVAGYLGLGAWQDHVTLTQIRQNQNAMLQLMRQAGWISERQPPATTFTPADEAPEPTGP